MECIKDIISQVMNQPATKIEEDGEVILSGEISDTKPIQYCYELFKPLSEEEIDRLAEGYRVRFPEPLADFYRLTNGAFLFGRHISIYGMPLWSAQYKQPIALAFADGKRTLLCPKERLFFACYNTDPEIQVFFNTKEPEDNMHVYAAKYGSNKIIAQWDSLEDWFVGEHDKYLAKYRKGEYRVDDIAGVLREIEFDVEF